MLVESPIVPHTVSCPSPHEGESRRCQPVTKTTPFAIAGVFVKGLKSAAAEISSAVHRELIQRYCVNAL